MELWDAYDKDGNKLGGRLVRGEVIPDGRYHLVAEVLVRHSDGSYLLMQRSFEKDAYPGRYEASAGGSALKGESALEAARRELSEETGITAPLSMAQLSKTTGNHTIYVQFLCVTDCDKQGIKFQEGETIGCRWLSEEEFIRFVNSEEAIPMQRQRLDSYIKAL